MAGTIAAIFVVAMVLSGGLLAIGFAAGVMVERRKNNP